MSLVAYGSSDESEEESPPTVEPVEAGSSLFSSLPIPKQTLSKPNTTNNSTKQSVKISIPSLSLFKDEEDAQVPSKKPRPASKGSGLFAVLPPPKNLVTKEIKRTFVPHVISKKKEPSTPIKLPKVNPTPVVEEQAGSDISDEEDVSTDFFKLNEPDVVEASLSIPEPEVASFNTDPQPEPVPSISIEPEPIQEDLNFIPLPNDDLKLDDEAIQKLVGRKRGKDFPVELIDISSKEIMPDANEWLVKQLTENKPVRRASHRKRDGPSSQQKRKHQITYLAHQAKEQEFELQNQWANSRLTKKQTQSKYGF